MLSDALKKTIQQAYSQFLEAKSLRPRHGQKLMIADIARTLGSIHLDAQGMRDSNGHLCVIEAGTGTGKTVAYLLSTLALAKEMDKKVVIATATVALQEQVVFKDLPDLIRHSGLNFQYSLAKGRGRYLCLSKLDKILSANDDLNLIPVYEDESGVVNDGDMRLYEDMMKQLSEGKWDGDKDNFAEEFEPLAWQRVTTDHHQCTGRKCSHVKRCAFFLARDSLEQSDCIVANHDLVLADIALGGGAILSAPEDTIYVIDEGHHLPAKALNHFSCHTRYRATIRWLGQSEGQWPNMLATVEDANYFVQLAEPLEALLKQTRNIMESGIDLLKALTLGVDMSDLKPRLRFERGVVPEHLEAFAKELKATFTELHALLEKMHAELDQLLNEDFSSVPQADLENLFPVIGNWLARAENNRALWDSYSDTQLNEDWPISRWISILEYSEIEDYEVVSSPILASRALENDLWSRCCGAVITSATLTALNSFERFQFHAGTYEDSCYSVVPSPFNYQENGVLCIPKNAVEANNAERHTDSIVALLPEILTDQEGSLVLFASRRQMTLVYDEMPHEIKNTILMQGSESKQSLLKKHKKRIDEEQSSVLFGLASFAEGIDLPGNYCEHVVIAKIPFAVPDDPVEASLAEWIELQGGNPFMQIAVPDASVKLIQACGRLLRTESDKGRVTILDKRLMTKSYGKAILDSLPPFKRQLL